MKTLLFILSLSLSSIAAIAEEGFHQHIGHGHTDNPMIPGSSWKVHDAERPQPPRVVPGAYVAQGTEQAPADAEILFDGSSLDAFAKSKWTIQDNDYILSSWGGLTSKHAYGDFQMHLEFRCPDPSVVDKPAKMGNSGIYIMGKYELQIFDSYSCRIYADGGNGAIYGQTPPLVNASRKPGEWQTFDIHFKAPVFEGDKLVSPARMTVLHNGVFIHIDQELIAPTNHRKPIPYKAHPARLPFFIQGGKCPVEFRNIWVRDLGAAE